jgi:hypothetical protein
MHEETVDVQARKDIAVLQIQNVNLQAGLDKINKTLDHIFTALLVTIAGAAGTAVFNLAFHIGK